MCSVAKDTKETAKHSKPEFEGRVFRKGVQKCTAKSERNAVLFSLFFLSMQRMDVKLPLCVFKVAISNSHPCVQAHSG